MDSQLELLRRVSTPSQAQFRANRGKGPQPTAPDSFGQSVTIEQAKGMLASRHGVHVDEAFEALRSHARRNQSKLSDVARAVVDDGYDIPPTVPAAES